MNELIILALYIAWLGILDGTMDMVKFKYPESIFQLDEPRTPLQEKWYKFSYQESWRNRYVDHYLGDPPHPIKWWTYLGIPYDFWHILKYSLVISIIATIRYAYFVSPLMDYNIWINIGFVIAGFALYGGLHDLMFKILKK